MNQPHSPTDILCNVLDQRAMCVEAKRLPWAVISSKLLLVAQYEFGGWEQTIGSITSSGDGQYIPGRRAQEQKCDVELRWRSESSAWFVATLKRPYSAGISSQSGASDMRLRMSLDGVQLSSSTDSPPSDNSQFPVRRNRFLKWLSEKFLHVAITCSCSRKSKVFRSQHDQAFTLTWCELFSSVRRVVQAG